MGRNRLQVRKTSRTRTLEKLAAVSWDIIEELEIDRDRTTLTYKAAVIIWFTLNAPQPIKSRDTLADWLGMRPEDVRTIYGNWRKSNLLRPDGLPVVEVSYPPEHEHYELSFILGLTMTALAGSGQLLTYQVEPPKEEEAPPAPEQPTKEDNHE